MVNVQLDCPLSLLAELSSLSVTYIIQGVSEIGALILTSNRTRQKEQLFYLLFCRKNDV
jgi:hypothetical protein